MLNRLIVKNFAIIEDIDISFKDGLTILTGETGAGKSLIIDCIHLLIGDRAQNEMIRNGEDKAIITGYFTYNNRFLESYLESLNIETSTNELTIVRVVSPTKSSIKVNNVNITLNDLKNIGKYLVDIHVQFDMMKLLSKENYLDIVDNYRFELTNEYQNKYLSSLEEFNKVKDEYNKLLKHVSDIQAKREEYEYELKEIKGLNLSLNEEEDITEELELLKNYDKIYSLLSESKQIVDGDTLSNLYNLKENIESLKDYQESYKESYEKLNDYYYELESIFEFISHRFRHLDYDPKRLDELETRLHEINQIKKKYNKDISELLEYQEELAKLLSSKEDLDILLKDKKSEVDNSYDLAYQKALDLSKLRKDIASSIQKDIEKNLSDLLLKSRFEIQIKVSEKEADKNGSIFTQKGIDDVEFMIETNIGEGLKPLAKIVSGGEASRIMLAIKSLFIKSRKIPTVIFDEIDTGISGEAAQRVAEKIHSVSLNSQVISITHLPQVAALSKNHIKISKMVKGNRTFTEIKELSVEEKIYEIASLISGNKVTDKQLEYAKEMVLK